MCLKSNQVNTKDKKENKNDILLDTLTKVNNLQNLDEKQLMAISKTIASSINLNSLKRNVNNVCMVLSKNQNIKMDNQKRLDLIYELLHNTTRISTDIRDLRGKNIKSNELLPFVENTLNTLEMIKEYQKFNEKDYKVQKETTTNTKEIQEKKTTTKNTSVTKSTSAVTKAPVVKKENTNKTK